MIVARRSALGRGLDSLIPPSSDEDGDSSTDGPPSGDGPTSGPTEVPVADIRANRYQPRVEFEEESLAGLAASIAELGVLQPLLVRRDDDGTFHLIAGERRLRASKLAGLETVPVLVRAADDQAALEEALVENLHREDLNSLEEAVGIRRLMDEFGLTQEAAAARLGKSRPAVTNLLRLLSLPDGVQTLVRNGSLSAGAARAVLALPDAPSQLAVATDAVDDQLSVRAVEETVRRRLELADRVPSSRHRASRRPATAPPAEERPPGVVELEHLLSDRLNTPVGVELQAQRGRISIDFADLDDLERIYRIITGDDEGTA